MSENYTIPTFSIVREGRHGTKHQLRCAADVAAAFADIIEREQEEFWIVYLDVRSRMFGRTMIARGSQTKCLVDPKDIFRGAICAGAISILLVHNHPSGDPSPSREDHEITRRLKLAGELLGLPIVDHVVIGTEGYTSFQESGWL